MDNLSSSEIGNLIDEKDKEISKALADVETIHQGILDLRRKRLELESSQSKAKYVVEKLKIERSLLRSQFWHCKNQGL